MTTYITTLNAIRMACPCKDGWEKLLSHLGKTKADDEPLPLLTILDSNGLDDALWVLSRAMQPEHDRLSRHFQAWCAEQVLRLYEAKHPGDTRIRNQIAMLRNDAATPDERTVALDAAGAAARAAAGDAAWCAAWAAARSNVWGASESAAGAAAWGAKRGARVAARVAAEDAQEQQFRKMLTEGF